ncbi:MAG: cysteine dioxygenase family protein [Burkholderiales bacterium]|nr:cysteine dioxygenase family protein [Burkholderiales bacterium]
MKPSLRKLIEGTAAAALADGEVEPQALLSAVRGSLVDLDLLAEEHRLSKPDTYTRHLLYADPNGLFSILALVWGPGQGSPVHGHHTWCCVGVYAGELTESFYRLSPGDPHPVEVRTVTRPAGDSCFDSGTDGGIHRIVNRSGSIAISIHIYGVGEDKITTGVNRIYPMPA